MKKLTQKATTEICKNLRVCVLAFDPKTMRRTHSYGGLHPLQALAEVAHRTTYGERVLILPDSDPAMTWEIQNRGQGRIPFQIAQQWALKWKDVLGEYRQ